MRSRLSPPKFDWGGGGQERQMGGQGGSGHEERKKPAPWRGEVAKKVEGIDSSVSVGDEFGDDDVFQRSGNRVTFLGGGSVRHHEPTIAEMSNSGIKDNWGRAVIFTDIVGHAFLHKVRENLWEDPNDESAYQVWLSQMTEEEKARLDQMLGDSRLVDVTKKVIKKRQQLFRIE